MTRELCAAGVILSTVLADLLQSFEMKRVGELDTINPSGIGAFLATLARKRFLILAVFFMAVSFFSFIKLLSVAEMSYAVPVSALTIVIETVLARLVLKEQVDWRRWAGAALVAAGVYLVAI